MSKDFTQDEYRDIRTRAILIHRRVKNHFWKRAYLRLADAADALDAMEARTIEKDKR